MSKLIKGIYRHYKGGEYQLLSEALTSDKKREVVVYQSLKDKKIWIRDKKEFLEELDINEEKKTRFELIKEEELDSFEQKYLRALADYQNLLKQSAKEKIDFVKFAVEDFLSEILPVYDHLKLALSSLSPEEEKSAWVEGLRCVLKEFKAVLENNGVEEIKTVGEKFNHQEMEAISGSGEIVEKEVMPGYRLKGKVIRIAKVIVKNN